MPAYVKTLAKKKGVPVAQAEEKWDKATEAAEKQGQGDNYAYRTAIFKNMMHESSAFLEHAVASTRQLAGLSPVLYHKTTVRSAALILQENRFSLKPTEGTEAEMDTAGSAYYLSCARSVTSDYIAPVMGSSTAIFELDGTKLAQRYRGIPVDYWGNVPHTMGHDEMEDRVLSPTPTIPAKPYVTAIHAVASMRDETDKARVSALHRAALRARVPIYWYEDAKYLLTRSPKNRLPVKVGQLPQPAVFTRKLESWSKLRKDSDILPWLALWKIPKPVTKAQEDAFYQQRKAWRKLRMAYENLQYSDGIGQLNADMHNCKGTPHGDPSMEREHLDELVKVMRHNRLTPKAYFEALRKKWFMK